MPCSKCGKGSRYKVVLSDGRVVFQSSNETTAQAVSNRYPGSTVVTNDG